MWMCLHEDGPNTGAAPVQAVPVRANVRRSATSVLKALPGQIFADSHTPTKQERSMEWGERKTSVPC